MGVAELCLVPEVAATRDLLRTSVLGGHSLLKRLRVTEKAVAMRPEFAVVAKGSEGGAAALNQVIGLTAAAVLIAAGLSGWPFYIAPAGSPG